jgi:hypothetical protein
MKMKFIFYKSHIQIVVYLHIIITIIFSVSSYSDSDEKKYISGFIFPISEETVFIESPIYLKIDQNINLEPGTELKNDLLIGSSYQICEKKCELQNIINPFVLKTKGTISYADEKISRVGFQFYEKNTILVKTINTSSFIFRGKYLPLAVRLPLYGNKAIVFFLDSFIPCHILTRGKVLSRKNGLESIDCLLEKTAVLDLINRKKYSLNILPVLAKLFLK